MAHPSFFFAVLSYVCVCVWEREFPGLLEGYCGQWEYALLNHVTKRETEREADTQREKHWAGGMIDIDRTWRIRKRENTSDQWKTLQGTNERRDKRTWRKREELGERKEGSDCSSLYLHLYICVCVCVCFSIYQGEVSWDPCSDVELPHFTFSHFPAFTLELPTSTTTVLCWYCTGHWIDLWAHRYRLRQCWHS